MLFGSLSDILAVLVVGLLAYLALIAFLRVIGKRALSKLNAFDFLVTIALGSILSGMILNSDTSLLEGIAAFAALLGLQWAVSSISTRWRGFAKVLRSRPRLMLRDGKFIDRALTDERFTRDEVIAEIRKQGHGRYEDIAAVVLESDGTFSVIADGPCEALSVLGPVRQPEGDS